jgi:multidrug efflux pump subunit AcrB
VAIFGPPPVDGLGSAGGFKLMMQDRAEAGLDKLQGQGDNLAFKAMKTPGFVAVGNNFRANTPQMYVNIDRVKCKLMGVALQDVFNTLSVYLGGSYVNDFNQFGRTWQVNIQAQPEFRMDPEDVGELRVKNKDGEMLPLASVCEVYMVSGPVLVTRYNMYTAATITGVTAPGVSTGDMIVDMEKLANKELDPSMSIEWTELTFLQIQAGNTLIFAFAGAVLLVFLILAAQYESWSIPLSVLLVVPMCLLAATVGIAIAHMDLNIFVQVGFIVLVGLACKNAILIVEFAREKRREGMSTYEAALTASKLRLRPIVMTSFAFILGVVPLVIGKGAGAEMRNTLGVAVFSGMLGVTIFGIFLTPVFYYVLDRWFGVAKQAPPEHAEPAPPTTDGKVVLATAPGPPHTGIQEPDKTHGS